MRTQARNGERFVGFIYLLNPELIFIVNEVDLPRDQFGENAVCAS